MLRENYRVEEMHFAYAYHAYLRWCTHRLHPYEPLARLDHPTLQSIAVAFHIHTLEVQTSTTELRTLVSLRPAETISACASKLKGQTSKWLRANLGLSQPTDLLSKGYFAVTSGKSTSEQVRQYLDRQSEHHGYAERRLPPVYVESYVLTPASEAAARAKHAWTLLRLHLVLATWRRRGVFAAEEARAVAARWCQLQSQERFALLKVSFVPDHVHVAVQIHPRVAPADLVVTLLNSAQEVVRAQFVESAVVAKVERLWQPSAYIGSFGDLASPQIQQYIRNWQTERERPA